MNLHYISQSEFFDNKANSIHVFFMCNEFSKLFKKVYCYSYKNKNYSFNSFYGEDCLFSNIYFKNFNFKFSEFFLAFIKFLILIFKYKKNDVVFSRCLYTLFFLKLFTNIQYTYETHSIKRSKLLINLEKYVVSNGSCNNVVVITSSLFEYFSRYTSSIVQYHDCCSLIENDANYENHDIELLYTGSILPGKGTELLYKFCKKFNNYNIHIVGATLSEFRNLYNTEPPKNLIFLGRMNYYETRKIQTKAKILLLPNQKDVFVDNGRTNIGTTTSPLKLFEYLSTGNIILSHEISSYADDFRDNLIIVKYNDLDSWFINIVKILENYNEYLDIYSKRNCKLVRENFTWKSRVEYLLEYL